MGKYEHTSLKITIDYTKATYEAMYLGTLANLKTYMHLYILQCLELHIRALGTYRSGQIQLLHNLKLFVFVVQAARVVSLPYATNSFLTGNYEET